MSSEVQQASQATMESLGEPVVLGGDGCCGTPDYVKSASFLNHTWYPLDLTVTFQSLATKMCYLKQGQLINVNKSINHGSYTSSDPIESVKAYSCALNTYHDLTMEPEGVEELHYVIRDDNDSIAFDKYHPRKPHGYVPLEPAINKPVLPPQYVTKATLVNTTGAPVHATATFESNEKAEYLIPPHANIVVHRTTRDGTCETVDPVKAVRIGSQYGSDDGNGVKVKMHANHIEQKLYVIGDGNRVGPYTLDTSTGESAPTNWCGHGGAPTYVKSGNFVNTSNDEVQVEVTYQSGHTNTYQVGGCSNVEVSHDYMSGTAQIVDALQKVTISNGQQNVEHKMDAESIESPVFVIETGMKLEKYLPASNN